MLMYAEIMRELLAFMKNMQRILGLTIQEVVKKQMTLMYMCFETKLKKYVKRIDFSDEANKST